MKILLIIISLSIAGSVLAQGTIPFNVPQPTAVSSVNLGNIYTNGQWYSQVAVTYSDGHTEIVRIPLQPSNQ